MVTTDKAYRNNEWTWPYREDDILGGHDPTARVRRPVSLLLLASRFFSWSAGGCNS